MNQDEKMARGQALARSSLPADHAGRRQSHSPGQSCSLVKPELDLSSAKVRLDELMMLPCH